MARLRAGSRVAFELLSPLTDAVMAASTTEPAMKTNDKALDAFIARKAEIDNMLTRLAALSEDHFGYAPDKIDWGHVGTLAHYAETLKRITDAAFREGEHAA
jgi:hypothetical protein